jgi:hypothetical protein
MASLAPAIALLSLGLTLCPMPFLFFGLGLGILGITLGWTIYRRVTAPGPARLFGAGAVTISLFAVLLAATRITLSIVAAARLERMLG